MILTKTYLEPKHFYRKIENIFRNLETKGSSRSLMQNLISKFFCEFCEPLKLLSAHLYERTAYEIELVYTKGSFFSSIAADLLEKLGAGGDQKEVQEFPWVEPLHGRIVAVLPGSKGGQTLMAFIAEESDSDEETKLHWNTVFSSFHYAMTQHFRRLELLDTLEQARAIQISLLPDSRTHFCDFDVYAESKPAELVGGDFFDIQQLEPKTLAIAIADAAGHGLPAALQARDVVIGLRMGLEKYGHITSLIEKLNRVIHRSGLVSRFISLFFAELQENGDLIYVNAGHPGPLLLDDFGFRELTSGGMILGPMPDSRYHAEFAHISPGSALVLFSDGVIEHSCPEGNEFGLDRLKEWMIHWRYGHVDLAVKDLFGRLQRHGHGKPFGDDITVLFMRRLSSIHNLPENKNLQF
jgi:serine phosphatase RsbU (regulator of sigma subunit)